MARSKSKHIRLVMRRRKQHKQRMKRRKADAKAVQLVHELLQMQHASRITLRRLATADVEQIVRQVRGRLELDAHELASLVQQSAGNPFYLRELLQAPQAASAVATAAETLGGKLEAVYYTFGQDDVIVILDMPDNISAAALSLAVGASGLVHTKSTALLTVDEVDKALGKSINYRPPGR